MAWKLSIYAQVIRNVVFSLFPRQQANNSHLDRGEAVSTDSSTGNGGWRNDRCLWMSNCSGHFTGSVKIGKGNTTIIRTTYFCPLKAFTGKSIKAEIWQIKSKGFNRGWAHEIRLLREGKYTKFEGRRNIYKRVMNGGHTSLEIVSYSKTYFLCTSMYK